ncbi:hypothetical protein C8Q77DRAFT_1097485 [Trametes polyzona]|nr:hypothetical protein C8Q77DRAFT_1097485 [Trametes polyzona]
MAEVRARPDVAEIKDAYDYLFNAHQSVTKIKDAALAGRLFPQQQQQQQQHGGGSGDGAAGVAGRSMAWKLFLVPNEPLQTVADVEAAPPLKPVQAAREAYKTLLMERMRAPDGGYEEGFTVPGQGTSPPRTEGSSANLEKNNPLSLHDENPWREWFTAMELRKTILQDVERTFPDIAYFRDAEVQAELTNILFLYSTMHPDIGYRQGMHELLAPLYYAVDYDSIPAGAKDTLDPALKEFCAHQWVAADSWLLFSAVMKGAGRWYEWQEGKTQPDPSPLPSHVQLNVAAGDARVKPYIAPIVEACNRVQSVFLKGVDPELWKAMQSAGIEPQIYGIRWLRLLFTREFNMQDAMVVWDGLFAVDPSFDLALWICVAMLIRIRNKLIPADYSTQLTYLLRYPGNAAAAGGSREETPVHHATLLLRQALTLQMSPTPTIGVSVIHENKNLLGIPTEVPPPISPPVRRRPRLGEGRQSFTGDPSNRAEPGGSGSRAIHNRQQSSPMGLPESLARGILERGESLGINKTVMNAVSELKRNLPDLATALGRLPLTPQPANAAYPLSPERPTTERPPWEPRSRFEMEREIAQLQALQRKLGDTVGWVVDTLLLDESEADEAAKKTVEKRKREALECLSYVRDVLKGAVTEVEDERLVGEEELKRRREKERQEREAAEALSRRHSTPHPPLPAAATPIEARPQAIAARRSQESGYFAPHGAASNSPPMPTVSLPPAASTVRHPPKLSSVASAPPPSTIPTANSLQSPTLQSPTMSAPWNYTRSAFSSGAPPIATLPRVPPRTSTVLPRAGPLPPSFRPPPPTAPPPSENTKPKPKPPPYDPLGAIP